MTNTPETILGIDPGTREMGYALLRERKLVAYGVATLKNGTRPYDLIGQARRVVLDLIQQHNPGLVAIEEPLPVPTRRGALLQVIAQEVHERVKEIGAEVVEISPRKAREIAVENPFANKIEVAEKLVASSFPQLRPLVPKKPARAVLGLRPKDKYWLHMFDALALAVAVRQKRPIGRTL